MSVAKQLTEAYPDYKWNPEALARVKKSSEIIAKILVEYTGDFSEFVSSVVFPKYLGISNPSPAEKALISMKGRNFFEIQNFVSKVYSFGFRSHELAGNHENTDIGKFMTSVLKVDLDDITDRLNKSDMAANRIANVLAVLKKKLRDESDDNLTLFWGLHRITGETTLEIGDVKLSISDPRVWELVPDIVSPFYEDSQEILHHLRWIMQKDRMHQVIKNSRLGANFVSPPGNLKRRLIFKYAELARREIEYVCLSKDTTEGDLKQRREIFNGYSSFADGPCVRAAVNGRILVLDGIEKAERNVMPILNNLLENREMNLEDGTFLVHPARYDSLAKQYSKEKIEEWKLRKTSERFFVVALGVPIPRYEGNHLDPPFRSRFQARHIGPPNSMSQILHLNRFVHSLQSSSVKRFVSVALAIQTRSPDDEFTLPEYPTSIDPAIAILSKFPHIEKRMLLDLLYPFPLFLGTEENKKTIIEKVYERFGFPKIWNNLSDWHISYSLTHSNTTSSEVGNLSYHTSKCKLLFSRPEDSVADETEIFGKAFSTPIATGDFVETPYHTALLVMMLAAHSYGDFCIIGDKGGGKSSLLRAFIQKLGYGYSLFPLYKDISARDLLQRRATNSKGDTVWINSPLVMAALDGDIAILDQIETLSFAPRIRARDHFTRWNTFGLSEEVQKARHNYEPLTRSINVKKCFPIHPNFRIVAVARHLSGPAAKWLSPEVGSLFLFVPMRSLSYEEEEEIILRTVPLLNKDKLESLLKFVAALRKQTDDSLKNVAGALSTRQLLRISHHLASFPHDSLHDLLIKATLGPFQPLMAREIFEEFLKKFGIEPLCTTSSELVENELWQLSGEGTKLEVILITKGGLSYIKIQYSYETSTDGSEVFRIGNIKFPIDDHPSSLLIPDIVFYDNPRQLKIIRDMVKDLLMGESILLIGNQGVGKNKVADRLLQLLKMPREYIQLHRDTTIYSLTTNPALKDGKLVYEDSALVRAVKLGHTLIVDEADKAPTHVTAVLKNLVEDGEMVLVDGRRIVSERNGKKVTSNNPNVIVAHPLFRMIVLANRPGFPFLGNDFFREIETKGDVFATHCVDNPDPESELSMLKHYAPSIDESLLKKLAKTFEELRHLADEGIINYPYSTRELVSITRHLEAFPDEGLPKALRNLIIEVFSRHGISVGLESEVKINLGSVKALPEPEIMEEWNKTQTQKSFPLITTKANVINRPLSTSDSSTTRRYIGAYTLLD
ncbi:AAA domain-containing protein [Chytridium lagenaria]|nr:AAA domain-containing protein [Chytridium lagenaria]